MAPYMYYNNIIFIYNVQNRAEPSLAMHGPTQFGVYFRSKKKKINANENIEMYFCLMTLSF